MSEPTASATLPKNSRKSHHLPVTAPPAPIAAPAPLRKRVAARLLGLAAGAQCADLAEGAGDPEIAGDTGAVLAFGGSTLLAGLEDGKCRQEGEGAFHD